MNRVIQDGQELFDVTVTIHGETFSVTKNHSGPVANSGGGPGEPPPPPKK